MMWSLSCSSLTCPELGLQRPFKQFNNNEFFPECWENVQPSFTLQMRNDKRCRIMGDSRQLVKQTQCSLTGIEHLVIIVHGWTGSVKNAVWVADMVQKILRADQQQNLGIMAVDWKKGANFDWKSLLKGKVTGPYLQAAANTRYVGVAIKRIVEQMDPGVTIHCIGHSLGAHVCGFLGQAVKEDTKYGKPILERITGLDPAGPYFFHNFFDDFQNVQDGQRLDSGDASQVDILHTDQLLGSMTIMGRTDFYIGSSQSSYGTSQACCWHPMCDHSRAHLLFLHSLKEPKLRLPVSSCTLSDQHLTGCQELEHPPQVGYFYNGSHPGVNGVIFASAEVAKSVTEEDCLNGLGIVAGVTTACSKFGAYLCPWTLGIGCIVSAICEGVETGVVTDAKSACQACAQGRGSLEAMSYLQEGQEDILNLVNKVNDGIFQIHEKLDKITTQLDRIEIIVQYREIIVQYREIKRLFKYIKKDPETGLVVSDNNLENFLTLAMSLDAGLDRTLFQLFDLMNGIKGDPLLSNSIFTRYPEFCETENFAYLWGMITDCILMESIAFSMSAGQGRRELRLEQIQENLIKISEQYVEDCGCTRLEPKHVPSRHNMTKLSNINFQISCGDSMASSCQACSGEQMLVPAPPNLSSMMTKSPLSKNSGEEHNCAGECVWNEGSCRVKNDKVQLLGNESALEIEKLSALYKILPFSVTSDLVENIEDIPLETIQQVLQLNDKEYPGRGDKAALFHGRKFCRKIASRTIVARGILISGGWGAGTSVEVYYPGAGTGCVLPSLPDEREGHTSDGASLCGGYYTSISCITFSSGKWVTSHALAEERWKHTSWNNKEEGKIILMGGGNSHTTSEIISEEEKDGVQGFPMKYDTQFACAIPDQTTVIITGGEMTQRIVSRYGTGGHIEDLPSLNHGRENHGCGAYTDDSGEQVFLVAGGVDGLGSGLTSSTELLPRGSSAWVTVNNLPRKMYGGRGATLGTDLYMTGGNGEDEDDGDQIYKWTGQEWLEVGKMKTGRYYHAVSTIKLSEIKDFCT